MMKEIEMSNNKDENNDLMKRYYYSEDEDVNVDDDDDLEEVMGLLDNPSFSDSTNPGGITKTGHQRRRQQQQSHRSRWKCILFVLCLTIILMLFFLVRQRSTLRNDSNKQKRSKSNNDDERIEYPTFTCPTDQAKPDNVIAFEKSFLEDYQNVSEHLPTDMQEFLDTFRTTKFDAWGKTYEQVKGKLHDWKMKRFVPYMKNSSTIFESACGIGLNLYLTLEILQEEGNIENVRVYGNEYVDASTEKANEIFDTIPPAHATKGIICTGDSTDLSYIPDNSFDLVFTGYISTLVDPLKFDDDLDGDDDDGYYQRYKHVCDAEEGDWEAKKLVDIGQERQESWFGKWVSEMERIAKPGAPVIIESIARPFCEVKHDWGGPRREWWENAINEYNWDIDPTSLEFEDDKIFRGRYNLFMKKNKH